MKKITILNKQISILSKEEAERYKRFMKFEALLNNQCKSLENVLQECQIIRDYGNAWKIDYQLDIIEGVQAIKHNLEYCYKGNLKL